MLVGFIRLTGLDGLERAVHAEDIRLLEDLEEGKGVKVSLCDGSWFSVVGSVESIFTEQGSLK